MAFENLNAFTDEMVKRYHEAELLTKAVGCSMGHRQSAYARMDEVLHLMGQYYLTVLKRGAFKAQALYCLKAIRSLSPGYAEGLTMKAVKPVNS